MSEGIQFDEGEDRHVLYSRIESSNKTPKVVQTVADKWLSGDTKKATAVLLGVAVLIVIIAIFWPVVFGGSDGNEIDLPAGVYIIEEPGHPARYSEPVYVN